MFSKAPLVFCFLLFAQAVAGQTATPPRPSDSLKNISTPAFAFRSIGPATTGGRVTDIAVNPQKPSEYYVASGHGSLWKTVNNGTTFTPAFENQGSFAMGAVRIDPSHPNIVWVGTGENNNQSNAIYGDGVYKSEDGGKSWTNTGLRQSEHIGGIVIDPDHSNTVYVAAYGSIRNSGGDRGIYKTTDGGKTWRRVLFVSDNTGFFEVHMDPRSSTTLYAVAHQRMRKGYTGIGGGNESALYRSLDSGASWQKIMKGLPTEKIGRIGMAISPANPDIVYALVQAKEGSGLYRSTDRGISWTRQSSYISQYPFYMQKLFADPKDENRLYSMDLLIQVSTDGGKTFRPLGERYKHVDNHTLWIDPSNTAHLLSGNDGGVYETWDQGQNWAFKSNIPMAEIYKVSTDNALPFYNVYIGTQDNSSLVGPSRTINSSGIVNSDWVYTLGGDGFETQADWKDDNIIYAQYQNGSLFRVNKKTGERIFIQPVTSDDTGYRFDWDAALLLSRHDNHRLYFGGQRLFRSDDQGNSWKVISPDLTRGVPQKMQRLMDRSWSYEDLASKGSLANISTIAESPLDENMIYVGTGDGVIQVSRDGGKTWTRAVNVPGVNEFTRIHHLIASAHQKNVAYAACQAFTYGDYRPLLLKTTDGGNTWFSITANLPARGNTYTLAEDHVNPQLLFAGTQFGLYMSNDGGKEWIRFMNGLPTTTVMDIEIQRRENDLVVSTFGRGVYILDDYAALRSLNRDTLRRAAVLFPVRETKMFVPAHPFGSAGKASRGADFFSAPNPKLGAVFTYFVKDEVQSLKQKRILAEKEKQKKGEDIEFPSFQTLKRESAQTDPYLLFTITDEQGNTVRKLKTAIARGVQRIEWDLRYQPVVPISFIPFDDSYPWVQPPQGYMALPGTYRVSLQKFEDGAFTELVAPVSFQTVPLNNFLLSASDRNALDAFNKKLAELSRAVQGTNAYLRELSDRMPYLREASLHAKVPAGTYQQVVQLQAKLDSVNNLLNGDNLRSLYEGTPPPSLAGRISMIVSSLWNTTSAPTKTFLQSYDLAADSFGNILQYVRSLKKEVEGIEATLEKSRAPYTPGRLPDWTKN